jgi:GTP-binding protein
MKPVIALVGRPNVGKSTLFNRLTKTRDAIVADFPGLTRDRKYGDGKLGEKEFIVIDTGGLNGEDENLDFKMAKQTELAIEEANCLFFIVDAKDGVHVEDQRIAEYLRKFNKKTLMIVNKIDGLSEQEAMLDFYQMGVGTPLAIAASQGRGVTQMIDKALADFDVEDEQSIPEDYRDSIRIAVIGRPNVGKSTLINRLVGEERVLAMDMPGTTRDSIYIPFENFGQKYTLIDTAGIRKRSRVRQVIEKFSVIKALQAIDQSNVVLMVLDTTQDVGDQDLHLLSYVVESGRALVILANKWDAATKDQKHWFKNEIDRRLVFTDFADTRMISALKGSGTQYLLKWVNDAYKASMSQFNTAYLTGLIQDAQIQHQPPLINGRRSKFKYAHQGGRNPPIIILHGNQTASIPTDYKRYLINYFMKALKLKGTPLRVEFKASENPFKDKKNKLSSRQVNKKRRLMKHYKKK